MAVAYQVPLIENRGPGLRKLGLMDMKSGPEVFRSTNKKVIYVNS
jgi:hypothetical protein